MLNGSKPVCSAQALKDADFALGYPRFLEVRISGRTSVNLGSNPSPPFGQQKAGDTLISLRLT